MKTLIIALFSAFIVMLCGVQAFAQGNNVNPQVQTQNMNYYDYIYDDINPIQANLTNQQSIPSAQQQGISGSGTNTNNNGKVRCKDCDAVKAALKEANRSSSGGVHRKALAFKKWGNKLSRRANIKMKKIFAHRKKIRTNYEVCFNWH